MFVAMLYASRPLRPGTCPPWRFIFNTTSHRKARAHRNTWVLAAAMGAAWVAHAEVRPHPVPALAAQDSRWKSPAAVTVAGYTAQAHATGASVMVRDIENEPAQVQRDTAPATASDGRIPSTMPTPIDNPWALGLVAVLALAMLWLDQRQRLDTV